MVKFYRTQVRLELPNGQIIEPGTVFTSRQLSEDKATKLIEMECVSEAHAPPLSAIPGWKSRATKLYSEKIVTVAQFFETPDEAIATICDVKPETVRQWKDSLLVTLEYRR